MGKKNKDIEAQKLKTPVPKAQNPEKPLSLPSKKIQKAKKLKQPNPNPIKNNEKQLNPQGNSSKTNQKTNKSNKKASKSKQLIKTVQKVESIEKNIEIEALTDEYSIYIKEKLAKLDSMKVEIKAGLSLDNKLIKKAISALLEYNDRTRNPKNLLDTNEGFIYVELSFSKLPEHYSIRPIQM